MREEEHRRRSASPDMRECCRCCVDQWCMRVQSVPQMPLVHLSGWHACKIVGCVFAAISSSKHGQGAVPFSTARQQHLVSTTRPAAAAAVMSLGSHCCTHPVSSCVAVESCPEGEQDLSCAYELQSPQPLVSEAASAVPCWPACAVGGVRKTPDVLFVGSCCSGLCAERCCRGYAECTLL